MHSDEGDPLVSQMFSWTGDSWAEHFGGWFAETLRAIATEITPAKESDSKEPSK